jgi:hypothetical protein
MQNQRLAENDLDGIVVVHFLDRDDVAGNI